jgi:hypothetical protein
MRLYLQQGERLLVRRASMSRRVVTLISTVSSSGLAVIMSPLRLAFQPPGKVIAATGLSAGNFSVSAKTGFAIKTGSSSRAESLLLLGP